MDSNNSLDIESISTMRLYGGAIAIVSGIYSLLSAITGMTVYSPMMGDITSSFGLVGWIMILVGLIVLIHGIILLTPYVSYLGSLSGPLMIVYSVVMILNQAFIGSMSNLARTSMRMSNNSSMEMTLNTGWDMGMIAIAVLMFISGLIMSTRKENMKM